MGGFKDFFWYNLIFLYARSGKIDKNINVIASFLTNLMLLSLLLKREIIMWSSPSPPNRDIKICPVASWWDECATWWRKTLFAAFKNAGIPRQMARASAGQRCCVCIRRMTWQIFGFNFSPSCSYSVVYFSSSPRLQRAVISLCSSFRITSLRLFFSVKLLPFAPLLVWIIS